MEKTKIYKMTLIFDDGSNCKAIRPGNDVKAVLLEFL